MLSESRGEKLIMANKRVSYEPMAEPLQPCCEATRGRTIQALLGIRADTGQRGYILHSEYCACDDRWMPHDWGNGHLTFAQFPQGAD